MNENFFAVYCQGDPNCEEVWVIPISQLGKELEKANTSSLQELAATYICNDCIIKFEHLMSLPDTRYTLSDNESH